MSVNFRPVVLNSTEETLPEKLSTLQDGDMAFSTFDKKIYYKDPNSEAESYGGLNITEVTNIVNQEIVNHDLELTWHIVGEEEEPPTP